MSFANGNYSENISGVDTGVVTVGSIVRFGIVAILFILEPSPR